MNLNQDIISYLQSLSQSECACFSECRSNCLVLRINLLSRMSSKTARAASARKSSDSSSKWEIYLKVSMELNITDTSECLFTNLSKRTTLSCSNSQHCHVLEAKLTLGDCSCNATHGFMFYFLKNTTNGLNTHQVYFCYQAKLGFTGKRTQCALPRDFSVLLYCILQSSHFSTCAPQSAIWWQWYRFIIIILIGDLKA